MDVPLSGFFMDVKRKITRLKNITRVLLYSLNQFVRHFQGMFMINREKNVFFTITRYVKVFHLPLKNQVENINTLFRELGEVSSSVSYLKDLLISAKWNKKATHWVRSLYEEFYMVDLHIKKLLEFDPIVRGLSQRFPSVYSTYLKTITSRNARNISKQTLILKCFLHQKKSKIHLNIRIISQLLGGDNEPFWFSKRELRELYSMFSY